MEFKGEIIRVRGAVEVGNARSIDKGIVSQLEHEIWGETLLTALRIVQSLLCCK